MSREGDLWRWDGFAVAAHAPTGAARRLAERGRLQAIEGELDTARAEVEAKRQHVEARGGRARRRRRGRDARPAPAARDAQRADRRRRAKSTPRPSARSPATRRASRRSRKRACASPPAATKPSAGPREADSALAALPPAAELEAKLAAINEVIAAERSACAEVRVEAQAIAREAELADRRLQAIAAERAGLERAQGQRRGADRHHRQAQSRKPRTSAPSWQNAPQNSPKQRQALIGEIETATAERRAAADRLAAAENDLAEADKVARAALEAVGEARAEAARGEERCDAAKRRLADLAHEIRELLEVEPDGRGRARRDQARRRTAASRRGRGQLERIRRERERLGAVNLRAEQELREVETQHAKLTSERDDLVEAIRRLRQGIHSLNSEARERLLSSFAIVNENFKKLFTELFGGGTAELQLIESEDPLEAGLEILAKPPGKKPATLSLLSGGEQALTALALIFAVFLTNPAPICVLDEVDAPLDDYNVERFCDLLDEMTRSTDTRFIIITHNPITMARMNRLYGVTMAERGVSQLVSVDLEGAVKLREAS